MPKFTHYKNFTKASCIQNFRYPHVCLACRKVFKQPHSSVPRACPNCAESMIELSRKFAAPKSTDVAQWRKVAYLIENGFHFESVYRHIGAGVYQKVNYPKTMDEAQEFVSQYRSIPYLR
jgi:predicted RNA-binding Zn-ribbon protein involved in translation (DUF1610 family)